MKLGVRAWLLCLCAVSVAAAPVLAMEGCSGAGASMGKANDGGGGTLGSGGSHGSGGSGGMAGSAGSGGMAGSAGGGSGGVANEGGLGFEYDGGCTPDILETGLKTVQNGLSVDLFDCQILEWSFKYKEPDPMIFKAIIYVESRFEDTSVACTNDPCGIPKGWTADESGCYGLMQVVPACHDDPDDAGLLADGHPNLETSSSSSLWATSIFNPNVNIEIGISGVSGNRAAAELEFPGCTPEQYTLMAVGNYNSYGSTKSCTVYNTAYDDPMLEAYTQYAKAAHYPAMSY